jgi:hypothetical protein
VELAIPTLRAYISTNWVWVKGGVYTYIKKIIERFEGEIVLGVEIDRILQTLNSIKITISTGEIKEFVRASVPEVIELYLPCHQIERSHYSPIQRLPKLDDFLIGKLTI